MKIQLGVTLGDPAGIGPEVVRGALDVFLKEIDPTSITLYGPANLLEGFDHSGPLVARTDYFGALGPSIEGGKASREALGAAIAHAKAGKLQALVTAPISKQAMRLAGSPYLGHTEWLEAELGGRGGVAMAFVSPKLRVALATAHIPLMKVAEVLSPDKIVRVGVLFAESLARDFGLDAPRLAVAGLNPHAGEGGALGEDEAHLVVPAIEELKRRGVHAAGPFAPDTVFYRAYRGDFDGVVALYHDQGLIPIKLHGFDDAVHTTLGLSIPRTSPDHGTAYDIAGQGLASATPMLEALRCAYRMAERRGPTLSSPERQNERT